MSELKSCPFCGVTPKIGYVCGEYFVYGEDEDCPVCGLDFGEMHSSEELEIQAWNRRVENVSDLTLIKSYHKPYADSTLNNMKKSELIEYVRMLEHNYNIAVSFNHQQAKNVEKMLEQKWIPVSERLPEDDSHVLVARKNGDVDTDMYIKSWWKVDPVERRVTHWMPLPEPPKECE